MRTLIAATLIAFSGCAAAAEVSPAGLAGEWHIEGRNAGACRVSISDEAATGAVQVRFLSASKTCVSRISRVRAWRLDGPDRITVLDADNRPTLSLERSAANAAGAASQPLGRLAAR